MSSFGFVRLVVCFYPTSGGTSAPIFRVMELVHMETVLSLKRHDSIVHGVRTHQGSYRLKVRTASSSASLVGYVATEAWLALIISNISLACKFSIDEGPAFDLKLGPMNVSVRSKQSYCDVFFDQACVD